MSSKATSSKHQGRHQMMAIFPRRFSESPNFEPPTKSTDPDGDATFVFVDGMGMFYSFMGKTGGQLMMWFKNLLSRLFDNGARLVVLAFDRCQYVPVAKSVEQRHRDRARAIHQENATTPAISEDRHFSSYVADPSKLDVEKLLPENWIDSLHDREGFRKMVIRFVCTNLIASSHERYRANPPFDTTLAISGSNLTLDDLSELVDDLDSLGMPAKSSFGTDAELDDFPLLIRDEYDRDYEGCTDKLPSRRSISVAPRTENRIGEAEIALPFFARAFLSRNELMHSRVLFYSPDTDMLFILLRFVERCAGSKVDWSLGGRVPHCIEWRYGRHGDGANRCDVSGMWRDIVARNFAALSTKDCYSKPGMGRERDALAAVESHRFVPFLLQLAQASAGTDYTQGLYGVTHQRFFDAARKFGGALEEVIKNDSFPKCEKRSIIQRRLCLLAFTFAKNLQNDTKIAIEKFCDAPETDRWHELADFVINKSSRLKTNNRFPDHLENRQRRLFMYLVMIYRTGDADLDIPQDLRQHGYGPLDVVPTRENATLLEDPATK